MISLYTGTVGSGKTLHAASVIRWQLNRGRPVLSNIQLAEDAPCKHHELYRFVSNREITPSLMVNFALDYWETSGKPIRENWITYLFDECSTMWNSRTWSEKTRLPLIEFFQQSRKFGVQVIFIAQGEGMLDKQLRDLVAVRVEHRKAMEYGMGGAILSLPFGGRLFARVSYDQLTGERLEGHMYVARRKDMAMYDTFQRVTLDDMRKAAKALEDGR